jgi:hypothetical protein
VRNIKRQKNDMRDWLGLHNREEEGCKRNRGVKAFDSKVYSLDRKA